MVMVLWLVIEAAISAVGAYNIAKGVYNMYKDADVIKNEYKRHQRTSEQYKLAQLRKRRPVLTDTQYDRYEDEFALLTQSTILDK
jgi:hypothetical protein